MPTKNPIVGCMISEKLKAQLVAQMKREHHRSISHFGALLLEYASNKLEECESLKELLSDDLIDRQVAINKATSRRRPRKARKAIAC